jgi:ribose 5-phosphate isomerase A
MTMNPKQRAAEAAMAFVQSGMVVGLGTGSTTDHFLQALGNALKDGRLKDIQGVPTSRKSELRALHLGIPLIPLGPQHPKPVVTVDGADEVDPNLDLIKGLGGALLREKVVAQNSGKLIVIADSSKIVKKLGTHAPLPVEVAVFAHETHEPFLRGLGADPKLRKTPEGTVFVTDNSNYIYDCHFPDGIADPHALETALKQRAGVVETGLFLGIAAMAIIAGEDAIETRERR